VSCITFKEKILKWGDMLSRCCREGIRPCSGISYEYITSLGKINSDFVKKKNMGTKRKKVRKQKL